MSCGIRRKKYDHDHVYTSVKAGQAQKSPKVQGTSITPNLEVLPTGLLADVFALLIAWMLTSLPTCVSPPPNLLITRRVVV